LDGKRPRLFRRRRARNTGFDRIAMDALMTGMEATLKPTGLEIKKGDMFGQPDR
jgi:hypothetical protein